jgi:hypothetical protein
MIRPSHRFRSDYTEQCRRFLVEETEAFLAGRLVDLVEAADGPLPAWLEINRLAHAAPAELRETGRSSRNDSTSGSWPWAREVLLRELVASGDGDLDDIAERQRRCLVPVELELLCEERRFASPAEVVAEGVARIRQAAPRSRRRPGWSAG